MDNTYHRLRILIIILFASLHSFAYDFVVDGIYYKINYNTSGTVEIASRTSGSSPYSGDVIIPESVAYNGTTYTVTKIGTQAFSSSYNLTSINIPNSVTIIDENAFNRCTSLTSICIPASVQTIGSGAFGDCDNLQTVEVNDENAYYCSVDNVIYTKDMKTIVYCANARTGSFVIPDGITEVGPGAFGGCTKLESIKIPESVTKIQKDAFYHCSLIREFKLPKNLIDIGPFAFYNSGIETLRIPEGITTIPAQMCYFCGQLTKVVLPNSVTTIGSNAFANVAEYMGSKLSIIIGDGLQNISAYAFSSTPLESITCFAVIPPKLSNIDEFSYSKDAVLIVPSGSYYYGTNGWKNFSKINNIPRCETPTVTMKNGRFSFACATEGVKFISLFTATDISQYEDNEVSPSPSYEISVYAKKEGYYDSNKLTKKINLGTSGVSDGDINGDGNIDVKDITDLVNKVLKK